MLEDCESFSDRTSQCNRSDDGDSSSDTSTSSSDSEKAVEEDPADTSEVPASTRSSHARPDNLPPESDGDDWESMSEVSDSPDVGDVQLGSNSSVPITREDDKLKRIDDLKITEHSSSCTSRST